MRNSAHSKTAIKKPTPHLYRPVQLNLGGLFKALPKAVLSYQLGKWDDAIAAAVDTVTSLFKLKKRTAEEQAYILIRRSLTDAVAALIRSATIASSVRWKDMDQAVAESLDRAVDAIEVTITDRFFKAPQELPLLKPLSTNVAAWFRESGLSDTQSNELAACLPEHFVVAVANQWRRAPEDYDKLAVHSPQFLKSEERERYWSDYRTWLQLQADPPLFDESFSLSSVYVDLRSYWEKPRTKEELTQSRRDSSRSLRIVGYLKDQMDAWLEEASPRDAVRVVSGGPGSGKSVFAKRLAAERANRGDRRVIYVPLHQFQVKSALRDGVQEFCRQHPLLPDQVLDAKSPEDYLLVFDGLDELSKQGQIGQELSREFFDQIQVLTGQVNQADGTHARLLVLVCGRPVAVSATRADELCVGQVVHTLPYHPIEPADGEFATEWRDIDRLLLIDQRDVWWRLYGSITGEELDGMPAELKTENLASITGEPLLNYLVSLSRRGGLSFSSDTNRNDIYRDLLRRVYMREYDPRSKTPLSSTFEDFQRLLEEVALAAWHGGETRSTTLSRVKSYCERAGLNPILERIFPENPKAVVGSLFLQFYFHKSADRVDNEAAFEFTHKSFGEFLLACRLIRELDDLTRNHAEKKLRWTPRHSLVEWAAVFGPAHIEIELWRFLRDGVRLRKLGEVSQWQSMIAEFIGYQQQFGMPMESCDRTAATANGAFTFYEMNRQSINAESGLLVTLGVCAECTRTVAEISWPKRDSFGAWLERLRGGFVERTRVTVHVEHRKEAIVLWDTSDVMFKCLNYLYLRNQTLFGVRICGANMMGCDLREARVMWSIFNNCVFSGADLSDSKLSGSDFSNSDFCGADLSRADLNWSRLAQADLGNVKMTDARLGSADITGARLAGVTGLPKAFLKNVRGKPAILPSGSIVPGGKSRRSTGARTKKATKKRAPSSPR